MHFLEIHPNNERILCPAVELYGMRMIHALMARDRLLEIPEKIRVEFLGPPNLGIEHYLE